MDKIQQLYTISYEQIEEFSIKIGPHVKDKSLSELILKQQAKVVDPDKLSELSLDKVTQTIFDLVAYFELISFIISNEINISESVHSTPIFKDINIGKILRDCDSLTYALYDHIKHVNKQSSDPKSTHPLTKSLDDVPVEERFKRIFPESINVFEHINTSMLLADETIIPESELDKNANIVQIDIENTFPIIFGIQNLIDANKVKSLFPSLNVESGLNEELLKRFEPIGQYAVDKPSKKGHVIDTTENVYQYVGSIDDVKYYRKLSDYPIEDPIRHYNHIGPNMFVTNMENKRLNLLKRNTKIPKVKIVDGVLMGKIKNEFYNNKKTIADSIFDTLYKEDMDDETLTRLLSYSLEFENNKSSILADPKYLSKVKNFQMLNNIFHLK